MRLWLIFLAALGVMALLAIPPSRATHSGGYGQARIGGAFTLTDTHGSVVRDSDFRGRLMMVYMGYSHCPDICPMTLAVMSEALNALGPDAVKVAVIFISLDPERDTPQELARFLSAFNPRIVGLTGSQQAINEAAQAYKVFHEKAQPAANGAYLIDHSGFLYLMDGNGKYIMHFATDVKAAELVKAIRAHF